MDAAQHHFGYSPDADEVGNGGEDGNDNGDEMMVRVMMMVMMLVMMMWARMRL